jgi:hypothetical protein
MDDAVRRRGALPQNVEIVQRAAQRLSAGRFERGRGSVRAGQAEDLMACFEKFGDQSGADVSSCASNENAHAERPPVESKGCQ